MFAAVAMSSLLAVSALLVAASAGPAVFSGGKVRIGQFGTSCRLYSGGLGPPSYLVADIGKLGVPLLSAEQKALARKIQKYFNPKTLRFSFLEGESGQRFVVYDATGNPDVDPCSDNPAAYHVLNGADNEYLEPGETGNAYGIPGDAGLPTPGPWMPPSAMPATTNKEPGGSIGATVRPLDARWKIVREAAPGWLVVAVTPDKRITIVSENKQITALKTIDGQTLWQRSGFVTPALADGDRIIAKADDGRIVGLSVETGKTLWKTAWRSAASVDFHVDGDCIIVAIDPEEYDRRSREATILELSARTGATSWTRRTDMAFPRSRHFAFLRKIIIAEFSAFDEPSFGEVELLDRATGESVLRVHHARYEGTFRDELWLRSTSTNTVDGTIDFLRYRADGRRLEPYRYPAPSAGKPVEVQLSERHVFIASNNRLHRYDRGAAPGKQIVNRYDVSGSLMTVIGESPLVAGPFSATVYVPTSPTVYSGRRVGIDWSEQRHLVALSLTAAYVSANFTLFAITDQGDGFSSQGNCANPSAITFVAEDDVLVTCEFSLARYRFPR